MEIWIMQNYRLLFAVYLNSFKETQKQKPIIIHECSLKHKSQKIERARDVCASIRLSTRPQLKQLFLFFSFIKTPFLLLLQLGFLGGVLGLMGAGFSGLISDYTGGGGGGREGVGGGSSVNRMKFALGDVPESCVAEILMYLDPPDICKLAKLNRAFRGASSADFVWESKLPSNYGYLIEKAFDGVPVDLNKKEIYARLCRPNPFDGGTKAIWLDKNTGGVCLSIAAKGLRITGIDDRRYWSHIPTEESRFRTIAYLQQIWWFEVDGEVEFQFPAGTYSMFFRIHLGRASKRLGRRIFNSEHVHGWDIKPVRFQLSTSDGQQATSQCFLNEPGNWVHYHVGDFVVENPNVPTKIKFSMMQIDCTHTKGGLCLDSVFIYPSEFREKLKRS